jgi:hypothetical protein
MGAIATEVTAPVAVATVVIPTPPVVVAIPVAVAPLIVANFPITNAPPKAVVVKLLLFIVV